MQTTIRDAVVGSMKDFEDFLTHDEISIFEDAAQGVELSSGIISLCNNLLQVIFSGMDILKTTSSNHETCQQVYLAAIKLKLLLICACTRMLMFGAKDSNSNEGIFEAYELKLENGYALIAARSKDEAYNLLKAHEGPDGLAIQVNANFFRINKSILPFAQVPTMIYYSYGGIYK